MTPPTMRPDQDGLQHSGYGGSEGWYTPLPYSTNPQTSISPIYRSDYHPMPATSEELAYRVPPSSSFAPTAAPMWHPTATSHDGVWPSMLAGPPQTGHHIHIMPAGPLQASVSASTVSDTAPASAKWVSRRKLTDDERRQICIMAEKNPTLKRTLIGGKRPHFPSNIHTNL